MILRQGFLLLLPLLLLKSTASHPGQKRDTSSVSISKSSQSVINDGNPVNSEPASFSPHTASPSYYHLKEVVGNAIKVHKSHSLRIISSMIVGSSISASPEHDKKIKEGEAPPDTTKSEAQKVLDDGPMNSQADLDETSSAKSIKSSIKTMPTLAKRAIDFKLQKWNLKGWRGWNGRAGTSERTGGATQGIQKAPNMQKFQAPQRIQPRKISRTNMPNKGIKINNGRKVGSRFRNGVRVGRVRAAGRKSSRAGQRKKDKVVNGKSPVALPAMISDKYTVTSTSETEAGGKENSKRLIFDSNDSQTEGCSSNRNGRSKHRFHNPPGFSDFSNYESETTSRARNRGKKNRNPITPNFKAEDYYSSSDSGISDSSPSFSKPKKSKSAQGRLRKKIKSSATNSRSPESKSVNSENKVSPVIFSSSSDEKPTVVDSGAKTHSTPASAPDGVKVQFVDQKSELPYGETGMSDSEGEPVGNHDRTSIFRNFRGSQIDDIDMRNYQMGGGGGGDNYGKSTGQNIGEAIGNILPTAQTIGNGVIGKGNMGHGVSGYDSSDYDSGSYRSAGSGSAGYSSAGYGSAGYSSGTYRSAGSGSAGYSSAGYGSDGYGSNGYGSNGYGSNGYGSSGYDSGGYDGGYDNNTNDIGGYIICPFLPSPNFAQLWAILIFNWPLNFSGQLILYNTIVYSVAPSTSIFGCCV